MMRFSQFVMTRQKALSPDSLDCELGESVVSILAGHGSAVS